jgi:hypothetical protein
VSLRRCVASASVYPVMAAIWTAGSAARGRVRRHAVVGGWVGIVTIAVLVAWLSTSNEVSARVAATVGSTHGAAPAQKQAPRIACSRSCFIKVYEINYSGTETLTTLPPNPSQPFAQAGRKLYIKLKWDLTVLRTRNNDAVDKRGFKVSGVVDLTIPDSPTGDCTSTYSLDRASVKYLLDNTFVTITAGSKAQVWTLGIPRATAACGDSSVHPLFTDPTFQRNFDQAAQPRFLIHCRALNKARGTGSRTFDFGPRASQAELSTVGLGKMEATIRSKVVIKGVKCGKGVIFG